MPLVRLSDHVFVVPGRTNVGVIVFGNECVIIDTGIDEDSGRRVLNSIRELNVRVRAVVNTHHHADHIGGDALIVRRTNALVYASPEDGPFIERPLLEPLYLYGAFPPRVLRGKFLEAEGVSVRDVGELRGEVGFDVVSLPGHTLGMVGIAYEGVLFSADAFFPVDVIRKYGVPYHLDVRGALDSLGRLRGLVGGYVHVVPAHGGVVGPSEAVSIIDENVRVITRLRDVVLSHLSSGSVGLDDLVVRVLGDFGVDSLPNYFLNRSALLSYVGWLADEGVVELGFVGGRPVVSRVSR
jgi:glyoxylase-like metal-dependent hydrolase (beta-lactamase superfamily II)